MHNLPVEDIIKKIVAEAGITEEEVKKQIKQKLDELSGLISEAGAAQIIANQLKVKLFDPTAPLTIEKIIPGQRGIEIVGKARQVYEIREFSTDRGSGKVGNFLLQDPTGTIRIVLWHDQATILEELKAGDVVKIKNCYARDNNGRVELHVGTDAKLYRNPEGVTVDVDVETSTRPEASTKKIAELSKDDQNVTVMATIVQVFDPKFFAVCPQCNARAKEEGETFTCASHGEITPKHNYVMNLYLDDSTDNVRCVLWRDQVDQLLGLKTEEVTKYKDNPAGFEEQKTELLGMIVKIRGRVNDNQTFGRLELVAYDVEKDVHPEPAKPAEVTPSSTVVEEKTDVRAVVDDDKVESVAVKKEESIGVKQTPEDELFTLEDLEDLDD